MASISSEGKNRELKRITYRDAEGKQKTLRLGKCSLQAARTALAGFERVLEANRIGCTLHPDGLRWLQSIDDQIYSRVVALGLAQPKEAEAFTIDSLLERFDDSLTVQESTRAKYAQVLDSLEEFLGANTPLSSITPADADGWRKWIAEAKPGKGKNGKPHKAPARATVSKRVIIAKGVFRKAVRWGLIPSNPFEDLRAGSQSNPDRSFYVRDESIRAILEACPDDQWRAIIALSRYAGLRCPSEIVQLRWGDVNWERGRLMVRSPKTANHEGHAVRVVPIAPELRPILQDLFDGAEEGEEAVIPRLRDAGTNLRTQFERIIAKAGEKPWPRLFHNMRASCATDWVERFPAHVVASWLGHSPMIAAQHYLQTRDAHFDLAAGLQKAASNPATHTRPSSDTGKQAESQKRRLEAEMAGCGTGCDPVEYRSIPPEGLEPSTR